MKLEIILIFDFHLCAIFTFFPHGCQADDPDRSKNVIQINLLRLDWDQGYGMAVSEVS